MTLFIACLLIYHFQMDAGWYAVAAGIWMARYAVPALVALFD